MNLPLKVVPYRGGWDVIYEGARYAESHHVTPQGSARSRAWRWLTGKARRSSPGRRKLRTCCGEPACVSHPPPFRHVLLSFIAGKTAIRRQAQCDWFARARDA